MQQWILYLSSLGPVATTLDTDVVHRQPPMPGYEAPLQRSNPRRLIGSWIRLVRGDTPENLSSVFPQKPLVRFSSDLGWYLSIAFFLPPIPEPYLKFIPVIVIDPTFLSIPVLRVFSRELLSPRCLKNSTSRTTRYAIGDFFARRVILPCMCG